VSDFLGWLSCTKLDYRSLIFKDESCKKGALFLDLDLDLFKDFDWDLLIYGELVFNFLKNFGGEEIFVLFYF
jgi:hypothetical protein